MIVEGMMAARRVLCGFLLGCLAFGSAASSERQFPDRAITFVVPWDVGGSNDLLARELQLLLQEKGINLVIENHPGATGAIGLRRVATAAADGYTLGMGTSSTLAFMAQGRTPLKNDQFTHIALVSTDALLLLVPESSPYRTLEDFLDHMKNNPGAVSIGTPGSFNLNHLFAVMTANAANVAYIQVSYNGGAAVLTDLIGGRLQASVSKPFDSIAQIRQHQVRAVGVFANERLALLPDVPTFREKGYDVFPFGPVVQMAYIVGPADLPADVRDRLVTIFESAIQDERFKSFAARNAFLVNDLTADALTTEVDKVERAIKVVADRFFKQ
jgi:tripartite-type tricarboxylate transporter receptor subunit TctC